MTYNFTDKMDALLRHIVATTAALSHVQMDRVQVTVTRQRSRWREGLFAKVVPLRFAHGSRTQPYHGLLYEAPTILRGGVELLYVISFCIPRFLNRTFEEKIHTIFHELYHISPRFDGDIRRYGRAGRMHTKRFHESVEAMARRFLQEPDNEHAAFLVPAYRTIKRNYGDVRGTTLRIPQPRPIGQAVESTVRPTSCAQPRERGDRRTTRGLVGEF